MVVDGVRHWIFSAGGLDTTAAASPSGTSNANLNSDTITDMIVFPNGFAADTPAADSVNGMVYVNDFDEGVEFVVSEKTDASRPLLPHSRSGSTSNSCSDARCSSQSSQVTNDSNRKREWRAS